MSLRTNLTFKTISLFGAHGSERNTQCNEPFARNYATV